MYVRVPSNLFRMLGFGVAGCSCSAHGVIKPCPLVHGLRPLLGATGRLSRLRICMYGWMDGWMVSKVEISAINYDF